MASSHMPKTAPPREKTIMVTGMKRVRRARLRPKRPARAPMPASMAPVFWTTAKTPPMMRTKAMMAEAWTNPWMGETKSAPRPCGRWSTHWKESGDRNRPAVLLHPLVLPARDDPGGHRGRPRP